MNAELTEHAMCRRIYTRPDTAPTIRHVKDVIGFVLLCWPSWGACVSDEERVHTQLGLRLTGRRSHYAPLMTVQQTCGAAQHPGRLAFLERGPARCEPPKMYAIWDQLACPHLQRLLP